MSNIIARKDLPRIEKIEDFDGLQMGIRGLSALWAEELGMVPVAIPGPQFYESLQKGMVDLVVMNPITAMASFKLHEVAEYLIDVPTGVHRSLGFINKDVWNKLPQYIRDLWVELNPEYHMEYNRALKQAQWDPVIKAWDEVGRYKLAPEVEAEVIAKTRIMWDAWVADMEKFPTGEGYKEFLRDQIAYRDKLTGKPWTIISP